MERADRRFEWMFLKLDVFRMSQRMTYLNVSPKRQPKLNYLLTSA